MITRTTSTIGMLFAWGAFLCFPRVVQGHRSLLNDVPTVENACDDDPSRVINFEIDGVLQSKTCADITDPSMPECLLEEANSLGDAVWQYCPARCTLQSLCPISITCDNIPDLVVVSAFGAAELERVCGMVGGSSFCEDIEKNRLGYVWQHCQVECSDWSGCSVPSRPPVPSLPPTTGNCSNSPDLEVTFFTNAARNSTRTLPCEQMEVFPRRCTSPLVNNNNNNNNNNGGLFVWEQCQQECFAQSECPFIPSCRNAPESRVRFENTTRDVVVLEPCHKLSRLGRRRLSVICEQPELDLGGLVYQYCQNECFMLSGCPAPPPTALPIESSLAPSEQPSRLTKQPEPTSTSAPVVMTTSAPSTGVPVQEDPTLIPTTTTTTTTMMPVTTTEQPTSSTPSSLPVTTTEQPTFSTPSSLSPVVVSTTVAPSSLPVVTVPVFDVTIQGMRFQATNVGELRPEEIPVWETTMEEWFLRYYREENKDSRSRHHRFLLEEDDNDLSCPDERRRDARDICGTEIEFVLQETTSDDNGVPNNEITYDQRIVYSDPTTTAGSDTTSNNDDGAEELVTSPFQDSSANEELVEDLQNNIESFVNVESPVSSTLAAAEGRAETSSARGRRRRHHCWVRRALTVFVMGVVTTNIAF